MRITRRISHFVAGRARHFASSSFSDIGIVKSWMAVMSGLTTKGAGLVVGTAGTAAKQNSRLERPPSQSEFDPLFRNVMHISL